VSERESLTVWVPAPGGGFLALIMATPAAAAGPVRAEDVSNYLRARYAQNALWSGPVYNWIRLRDAG
jgi:hypothetical protein